MAHLIGKMRAAAFLGNGNSFEADIRTVSRVADVDLLDRLFAQLHNDVEALMFKAMDEYPVTQQLGRRRRRGRK